jgi:hypothetical protein
MFLNSLLKCSSPALQFSHEIYFVDCENATLLPVLVIVLDKRIFVPL